MRAHAELRKGSDASPVVSGGAAWRLSTVSLPSLFLPPDRPDPSIAAARLATLFDSGTFDSVGRAGDPTPPSGVSTGRGRVGGVPTIAYATDPAVQGGALGAEGCASIVAAIETAVREHLPVVGIWHSGGARLPEGVLSLHAVGSMFAAMVAASGRVPQLSLVLGPAAGGAAYGPALTDVVVTAPAARLFVTGPDIVRSVTGEDVDAASLGGPEVHSRRSGVVHLTARGEAEGYDAVRRLVALLARPGRFAGPDRLPDVPDLAVALPDSPRRAYDVRPLVRGLLDEDDAVELQPGWARNIVTMLGRLDRHAVGVIANNPLHLGGCLDSLAAEKAARFVRTCDAFGLPLVVLVDVPGYLPGRGQEADGVVRRGAKLLHAFAEAVVPRVTVITRKAYGGAFIAMNSRALGADAVYAWPSAKVAVMGAESAVRVLHRRRIAQTPEEERPALLRRLAAEHERRSGGLEHAVDSGIVDSVVPPASTRRVVARALAAAPPGRGRHTNIPL